MKKALLIAGSALLFITTLVLIKQLKTPIQSAHYRIGILQTASHPALDATREGFIQELSQKLNGDVDFIIQNAQGSIAHAHAIAQQFHADKNYTGFFSIATPATQSMHAVEKERPIFIAAVTDPNALGLVYPDTNVCGVKDMIDVNKAIKLITELVPTAKTIGIVYTSGETNSIILAQQMHAEAERHGLVPTHFTFTSEADIQAVVELACRKVNVIIAPTDNTVASTISLITSITRKNKTPLIVSDNMLVQHGALAAQGVDYKASGKRVADIAHDVIIHHKKPSEMSIKQAESKEIFINKTVLQELGLTIPEALANQVIFVS